MLSYVLDFPHPADAIDSGGTKPLPCNAHHKKLIESGVVADRVFFFDRTNHCPWATYLREEPHLMVRS